jgi:hypothetical protein
MLIKGAMHQEEITTVSLCASIVGAPNFIKHILLDLKTQIEPKRVVLGDFNTLLSPIHRSSRQKNQPKNSRIENDTIDLMGLTDMYRAFHPAIAQYIFFSAAQELSPKHTIFCVTKQVFKCIRKLK